MILIYLYQLFLLIELVSDRKRRRVLSYPAPCNGQKYSHFYKIPLTSLFQRKFCFVGQNNVYKLGLNLPEVVKHDIDSFL
jgi:hypothetical protein